jgi:hypothetical protein
MAAVTIRSVERFSVSERRVPECLENRHYRMGGGDLDQYLQWTESDVDAASRLELTRAFLRLQAALRDQSVVGGGSSARTPSVGDDPDAWRGMGMRTLSSIKENAEPAQQLRAAYAADIQACLRELLDAELAGSACASSMLQSTFALPVVCRV